MITTSSEGSFRTESAFASLKGTVPSQIIVENVSEEEGNRQVFSDPGELSDIESERSKAENDLRKVIQQCDALKKQDSPKVGKNRQQTFTFLDTIPSFDSQIKIPPKRQLLIQKIRKSKTQKRVKHAKGANKIILWNQLRRRGVSQMLIR